jgi:hypothetical protein
VPAECRHLDYLLFTPFRYAARGDSRFRRAGRTPGVFYAAERIETSVAEVAFWRLLFFIESPGLPWPANPLEFTGFVVRYKTEFCLDLTKAPYDADPGRWTHPTDYSHCHAVADEARGLAFINRYVPQTLGFKHAKKCAELQRRARKAGRRFGENDAWQLAVAECAGAAIVAQDRLAFSHLGSRYEQFAEA